MRARRALCTLALLSACGEDGVAAEGGETVCLEGSEEGEAAEDAGCLFTPNCDPSEDEGPSERLDLNWVEDLPCAPDCPPPPNSNEDDLPEQPDPAPPWNHDPATDTFYRLASDTERAVHGWPEGTALLSAGALVDGLVNGRDAPLLFALPVPIEKQPDAWSVALTHEKLIRRRSQHGVWHLAAEAEAGRLLHRAFNPTFHLYLPTWLELDTLDRGPPPGTDHFALAFGDSHGGVVVQAMAGGAQLLISGPTNKLWLELPAPDSGGVLVSRPRPHAAELDELLVHWMELGAEQCAGGVCSWELLPEELPPSNCRDCVDNDADGGVDGGDLACLHRSDYNCPAFGPHVHRREDVKAFAELPDVEWCTRMRESGLPWHTELYAQASEAAALLNAIPAAASLHPDYAPPAGVPEIHYRFAYCMFADSVEAAETCVASGENCPPGYSLGGIGKQVVVGNDSRDYFRRMWTEYDTAMHALEAEGITPKPVAMLSGIYSGNLNPGYFPDLMIGLASAIGDLEANLVTGGLGASAMEADYFTATVVAHELGHTLGLAHTLPDPFFGTNGIMREGYPLPAFAVLGPSKEIDEGYAAINQWSNWAVRIVDDKIPRPNAFQLVGCTDDDDCPLSLSCWNAGPDGICRSF